MRRFVLPMTIMLALFSGTTSTARADVDLRLWFNAPGFYFAPGYGWVLRFDAHPRRHHGHRHWPRRFHGHFPARPYFPARPFFRHHHPWPKYYRDHDRHRHHGNHRRHEKRRDYGHRYRDHDRRRFGYRQEGRRYYYRDSRGRLYVR